MVSNRSVINYYHLFSFDGFSHQRWLMFFQWSLSDSKSSQVSRTLLSILADFNNAVVWIVSIRPVIFKSSSCYTNPLVSVLRAPITISIIVTFMFLFNSLTRSRYLSFFSHFDFSQWSGWDSKVDNFASSLLFVDYYKIWSSGRNLMIRLYLENPEEFVCLIL